MVDLYWLTVLGTFKTFCVVCSVLGGGFLVGFIISNFVMDDYERERAISKGYITLFKLVIIITSISLLGNIFCPDKQELYVIYGVGSTIDYLKENPTAQQLPDKYIKVLDKWAEEELNNKK